MPKRLNVYQVATRYKVSVSTVYAWRVKNWIVPPIRVGGRVFWLEEELNKWEAERFPRPCDTREEVEV